jgi:hypothetical protein
MYTKLANKETARQVFSLPKPTDSAEVKALRSHFKRYPMSPIGLAKNRTVLFNAFAGVDLQLQEIIDKANVGAYLNMINSFSSYRIVPEVSKRFNAVKIPSLTFRASPINQSPNSNQQVDWLDRWEPLLKPVYQVLAFFVRPFFKFFESMVRSYHVLGYHRGAKLYYNKYWDDATQRCKQERSGQPVNRNPFREATQKESQYALSRDWQGHFWIFFGTLALQQATIHLDPYYAEDKKQVSHHAFTPEQWQVMNPQEIPKDIATDPLWLESGCRTKKQVEALAKTRAEWEKKNPDIADDEDIEPRLIPDHPPWLSPLDRFFLKYWFKTSPAWELTEAQRIEENKRFCKPVE